MITKALVVFVAMAVTDALYAYYTRRTADGRAAAASLFASLLMLSNGLVVVLYTENRWLLLAAAAGAFVGTYITVRHDARR